MRITTVEDNKFAANVDRVLTLTEVAPESQYGSNSTKGDEEKFRVAREGWYYTIRELGDGNAQDADAGTYFPGRAAEILLTSPEGGERVRIGTFGILHPEVLGAFDVGYPASCLEINLEPLM